jgi:ribonuclease HII
MLICGVDEAGRGPVIGPMVMCAAMMMPDQERELLDIGVKDSKQLSPASRERIYAVLKKIIRYEVKIVQPDEIDQHVKDQKSNLNWLEAEKTVDMLAILKPDKVYLDCPSNNIGEYRTRIDQLISAKLKKNVITIAAHKADEKYPIVSAASIIAKSVREQEITKLKEQYKVDFGSGYPSDPTTQAFLVKHWKDYPFFRTSWEPWQAIQNKKGQSRLRDY